MENCIVISKVLLKVVVETIFVNDDTVWLCPMAQLIFQLDFTRELYEVNCSHDVGMWTQNANRMAFVSIVSLSACCGLLMRVHHE